MPAITKSEKQLLEQGVIDDMLSRHSDWSYDSTKRMLLRCYQFRHFRAAMAFVSEAAMLFEKYNHHAEIYLNYNVLKLYLTSHDVGGLTSRDENMLKHLDKIPLERS